MERALAILQQALPDDLADRLHVTDSGAQIALDREKIHLYPVWVGEGLPHDLDRVAPVIAPEGATAVYIARAFSPRARDILEREGWAWVDGTGRARITVRGRLYLRLDAASRRRSMKAGERGWSPATGTIAESLLIEAQTAARGERWALPRIADLADGTGYSPAVVTRALQVFDDEGFTVKTGGERGVTAGRELADAPALLSAWAGWHRGRRRPERGFYALMRDVPDFAWAWLPTMFEGRAWAVSGWLGSEAIAPYSSQVPDVLVYVEDGVTDVELESRARRIGADPSTPSGSRIHVAEAPRWLLERGDAFSGVPVMPAIRVYGDLLRAGRRGDDAAEHLREQAIGW